MRDYRHENLTHDPIHGYIPFVSGTDLPAEETAERELIDSPWVQRMRHIHQLQTAWWVYPTAEHTRFPHVIGAMHLGSRACEALYASLAEICPELPSRGYVETLLRMAGLLHDVGHGPFGHFFDDHFLRRHGLTHELLGGVIIEQRLGDLLRRVRRNPNSALAEGETLDPAQIAWLIRRPREGEQEQQQPRWLHFLRSLLAGIYTIDNMDFVLRDAYMSGYSPQAFDLARLLHYSFFSEHGLTIHDRGIDALVRFMSVRAELFRSLYFHRTVRAIDLTLKELFEESRDLIFDGDPREQLDSYLELTESSLLVDVARWHRSTDPRVRELGLRWRELLQRKVRWHLIGQRVLLFDEQSAELSSVFSDPVLFETALRRNLPAELRDLPLRVDIARALYRPSTRGPARGMNFQFESAAGQVRLLTDNELFKRLPVSNRVCRVYAERSAAEQSAYASAIAAALDQLTGGRVDDLTNM